MKYYGYEEYVPEPQPPMPQRVKKQREHKKRDEQKEQMSTMASCTAEKIHETMSAEGLQLIADGDFENQPEDAMTEEDQKALENAMMACLEEAFPELSTGE